MSKEIDVVRLIDMALKEKKCNMIMLVLPNHMKTVYPALKKATLMTSKGREIITQCVLDSTLRKKGAQSIHTKLLLQMAAKRGNILWAPTYSEAMNTVLDKVMMVGIDGGSKAGTKMMAACGSMNSTHTAYASATKVLGQDKNDQKYQAMLEVTLQCVEAYINRNKSKPKELIVFMNSSPGDQINLYQENYSQKLVQRVQ